MRKLFQIVCICVLATSNAFAQDVDITSYLINPGFDEDLTFQADGTMKDIVDNSETLSSRSTAWVAADGTCYCYADATSTSWKRTSDSWAINGFIGQVSGWTIESNKSTSAPYKTNSPEWVYFGTLPYGLGETAVPVADDGSTYLVAPDKPDACNTDDNTGFVYFRSGWGGEAVYKQTLSPSIGAEKYRLEFWAFNANYEGSKNNTSYKNLCKVTCGDEVFEDTEGFLSSAWVKHSIEFTSTSDFTIQLGYKSSGGSNSNPFLIIDDVKLYAEDYVDYTALDDVIYMERQELKPGRTYDVPVYMNNSGDVTACQFDLYLPDGISVTKTDDVYDIKCAEDRITKETDLDGATTYSHSVKATLIDNYIRVTCTSLNNTLISGNSGKILTVSLQISEDIDAGLYKAYMNNQVLANTSTETKTIEKVVCPITVLHCKGDVNDDDVIDAADYVGVLNLIAHEYTDNLYEYPADVNEDGEINVADCVGIVNHILYGYFVPPTESSAKARAGASGNANISIQPFDISAGESKTIAIELDGNPSNSTALQFDMVLPEGINIAENALGRKICWNSERTGSSDHNISSAVIEDGSVRVIGSSLSNAVFNGASGAIMYITLKAYSNLDSGKYNIGLKNVKLADTNTSLVNLDDYVSDINVSGPTAIDNLSIDNSENISFNVSGCRINDAERHNIVRIVKGVKIYK